METKDKLERLQKIDGCVVNITVTFDLGLQIDVLTDQGFLTNIGNYGQWPCFCFPMTDEVRKLQTLLQEGKVVDNADFWALDFCKTLTNYHTFVQGNVGLEQDHIKQIVNTLKEELIHLQGVGENFYAFAAPEDWNMDFKLFASLKDLEKYFLEVMGEPNWLYSEMSQGEIDECYNLAEDSGWGGLPLQTCDIEQDFAKA